MWVAYAVNIVSIKDKLNCRRSDVGLFLDTGSTPVGSTKNGSVELLFFRNEFALIYRLGNA